MNIEQAKAIPIAQILSKLELKPVKEKQFEDWYLSPFRNENTPSFHVNKDKNVWFDHGEGVGGNSFDLVIQILKSGGYGFLPADGLRWLRNTNLDPSLPKPRDRVIDKSSKWKIIDVMDLENLALFRYLRQRGIDINLAKKYLQEIYVRKKGTLTRVYALGFKNEDGGYEMRNNFFKSCIAPKTITFIRADKPKPEGVMIFEGFMDFLTYLTIKEGELASDNIVLNSVACVDHAIRYIKNYGYRYLYTWTDNDKAGNKAQQQLDEFTKSEPGLVHKPMNNLYKDFKDLNEWHMTNLGLSTKKVAHEPI
jgi:hypothetical protein